MAWIIDKSHSSVTFSVRHMMVSTVRGQFREFDGNLHFDENDPAGTTVDVVIKAASLNTGDDKRDEHLKSPDFLDVAKYPTITFKSKSVKEIDATRAHLIGDLTIRDVTKEVVLDTEYHGQAKSPWGTTNAGFSAKTKINRKDWGLNWNVALEAGGWLVSDTISIDIELEIVKQPEAVPVAA